MHAPYVLRIRTGLLAMLTVCQLLLTVRNNAAVLDRKVLLSSFHLNCRAHFRI